MGPKLPFVVVVFYKRLGFGRVGHTEPMWIYSSTEH